jgi:hypothetical protein
VIEYRNVGLFAGGVAGTFEAVLYEHLPKVTVNYQSMTNPGASATSGVQLGTGPQFTQYSCNSGVLTTGKRVDYLYYTGPPRIALGTGAGGATELVRLVK